MQSTLLILRYSLATKLIYFAQTIDPQIVEPFAVEFDQIMRDTYLRLVDIESLSEAQQIQLGLPLKDGGCGLRSHTLNELRRRNSHRIDGLSGKSGKVSVENCSLSATPTAYNSILHFLQDLRGSSSAVGLLRIVLRSERRHN